MLDLRMDDTFCWPCETSSAFRTRLEFVYHALLPVKPRKVLDMGCGTGEHLTQYIARLFPSAAVYGVDSDEKSINFAKLKSARQNLRFSSDIPENVFFDSIIASEVLEHVQNPYHVLLSLRSKLRNDGLLVITVPNGYGCSEFMAATESLLHLSGALKVLRKARQVLKPGRKPRDARPDTLAISPHINFFRFKKLLRMFSECGFDLMAYQGRMFLHNFICSVVIDKSESLSKINADLGKVLPACMVSDWMFALKKNQGVAFTGHKVYQRNLYERMRKFLNQKRYRLS